MYNQEESLYKKKSYKELSKKNIYNTIEFLLKEGAEFSIIAYANFIDFNPKIPKDIVEFEEITMLMIAGYSFESALLDKDNFSFEAGFGEKNYGSVLSMPLEAIMQIRIDDNLLAINYYEPKKEKKLENSIDILLNNPENQKFLKKNINKK